MLCRITTGQGLGVGAHGQEPSFHARAHALGRRERAPEQDGPADVGARRRLGPGQEEAELAAVAGGGRGEQVGEPVMEMAKQCAGMKIQATAVNSRASPIEKRCSAES